MQIGLILMFNSIIAIIAPPLWGLLCDRLRSVRKIYICLTIILAVTVPVVTILPSYGFFLFWIPCMIILFYCAANPLLDAWVVQGVKSIPGKSFGSIRLWGSIGYMAVVALMGWAADLLTMDVVFWSFSFFALLSAVFSFAIRNEGVPEDASEVKSRSRFRDIPFGKLFKNKYYIIFIVCIFLLHLPMTLKFGFLAQRVYYAGGTDTLYGAINSISALAEIPFFIFSARLLAKFKPQRILKTSLLLYFVHFLLLSFRVPAWSIILIHLLQGVGYSMFVVSSVTYIDSISPVDLKTSALTFATALYGGASGIFGNLFAGFLIDSVGIINAFRYGSIIVGFAVLLYFVLFNLVRKRHPEPNYYD